MKTHKTRGTGIPRLHSHIWRSTGQQLCKLRVSFFHSCLLKSPGDTSQIAHSLIHNSFRISHTSHPPFLPSQVLFFSVSSSTSSYLLHWSFSLWNQVLHFCLHSFLISCFFIYKISKNYFIPMEESEGLS